MIRKFSTSASSVTASSAVKGAGRLLAVLVLSGAAVGAAHAQQASAPRAAASANTGPVKIGFVNTERIFRDAAPAKAALSKMEADFKKRDTDLQDIAARLRTMSEQLDKDSAVLSESDRNRRQRELSDLDKDFQRKRREFQEDLNQRRNEELSQVLERANRVIKQIAEQENYDLILQEAVVVSPRVDITDKVLSALNGGK
ncbi:OmpH family outer membrane protein [Pigmentiphaga litoralis]|uniref:Outer membrane protein n=1 Tax=Pigmentiphaga litoralis TaxID=516702 RepID=A0A7Y9IWE4_9BURK|nr:OmpH family outer membrane protein [Pigmentiphaga litoralis]NYE22059.1 outer membrane protein [Pigmentiphaga litoralis]NYE84326.1 outer membrane protein [Pigmentiphaga litoralis]